MLGATQLECKYRRLHSNNPFTPSKTDLGPSLVAKGSHPLAFPPSGFSHRVGPEGPLLLTQKRPSVSAAPKTGSSCCDIKPRAGHKFLEARQTPRRPPHVTLTPF